jgi:hypothetical protein
MDTMELIDHWKQHLRDARAGSLKGMRKYKNLYGNEANIVGYFEGKAQGQREAISILDYMIEYKEMFHGDS